MNAEELRELQDRGKFFYETFPGAAAAEKIQACSRSGGTGICKDAYAEGRC